MALRMTGTVIHLAPHPDDELLGAPATLMALRDAGYRIVNVACSLGRPEQRARREAELREASARAGFDLRICDPPVAMSSTCGDDLGEAHVRLVELVTAVVDEFDPQIVVSPSPHDRHPAHELVARATDEALRQLPRPTRWWMWGLWAALPVPTLGLVFDAERLDEILGALAAHGGELARADYGRVVRGRSQMHAALGPELLFGFGADGTAAEHVELLMEVVVTGGCRLLGRPRWLDVDLVAAEPSDVDVSEWLLSESATQKLGPPGVQSGGVFA